MHNIKNTTKKIYKNLSNIISFFVSQVVLFDEEKKNRYLFNFVLFLIIKFKYIRKKKRTLYGIIKHQKFNNINNLCLFYFRLIEFNFSIFVVCLFV